MKSSPVRAAAIVPVLAFLLAAPPARSDDKPQQDKPNLSGTWRLNPEKSDDPREKMRDLFRGGGGGRGGPGGGGFGRGGPGGRGGGRGGGGYGGGGRGGPGGGGPGAERGGGRGMFEAMNAGLDSLRIRHEDPVLHVAYADEREDTFYTDGRKVRRESDRGGAEIEARWKDGRVVVEEKGGGGGKILRTFELSPGHDRLYLTTRIDNPRLGAVTVRRVYDADVEAPPTSPAP